MVKQREVLYCNVKLLLIFLVIYGHLIEPQIESSAILMFQYKLIYFFHMPLFCFMTGLFMKSERACASMIKKTLPLYLILQLPSVILKGRGLFLPNWVLWYLLSCCLWAGLIFLWLKFGRRKGALCLLVFSVVLACAAGYVQFIGREFSLSRTIVFFPYVFIGVLWDPKFQWQKLRKFSLVGAVAAVILTVLLWQYIPHEFLYHADPYGDMKWGFAMRLATYGIGSFTSLFIVTFMTKKKLRISVLGADTLWPYIIHWPLAVVMKNYILPWPVYLLIAAGFITGIYFLTKLFGKKFQVVETL